ncbi:MAG TPA: hypothetical protein VN932_12025 [Rhizomicrobium sp.]|nr:hypothetical protein [Rhizomicrobium sp.]
MSGAAQGIGLQFRRLPATDGAAEIVAIVLLVPLLLAVALWNGFPIIFYDTGAYMLQGLGGVFIEERSPFYSLFLRYAGAAWSFWPVVIVQAAATAFVMTQVARTIAPRLPLAGFLAIGAGLVVLTGLPWYVGQIEPDCFTALTALCTYLLAFHAAALGRARAAALVAIAAFATAAHPSHLVLMGGFALVLFIYKGVTRWAAAAKTWPRANAWLPVLCIALGVVLVVAANYNFTRKVFIASSGPVFVFARLVQDGIVMRLLDDTCPQSGYKLCAYKDALPRTGDQWLWTKDTPFHALNGFEGTKAESEAIIWATLKRYPLMHLRAVVGDAARQFVTFATGDQIEPQQWVLYDKFKDFTPGQLSAYLAARQQKAEIDFVPINWVHVPFIWLSLAAFAAAFGLAIAREDRAAILFLGFVLLALVGNATVCGALSIAHDRYQSRLIWLVPFSLALIASGRSKPGPRALRACAESGT